MASRRISQILLLVTFSIFGSVVPLSSIHASSARTTSVQELQSNHPKDRASYNKATSELKKSLKKKKRVLSYEKQVDAFMAYDRKVSRQEIGTSLYKIYAKAGPKPKHEYYGDKVVVARKAAATRAALEKSQKAAAEKARIAAETKAAADAKAAEAQAQAAAQARAAAIAPANGSHTYVNSAGNTVASPNADAAGASARCNDGTYSHSQSRRGTCSGHGGVAAWL